MRDIAYLKLLAREYPTIQSASTEIINLTAIQGLPKGTEYFFSDLHGEHEAFIHLLRSSSGIIREKIKETFGYVIPEDEQDELANLIYYPKRTLNQLASPTAITTTMTGSGSPFTVWCSYVNRCLPSIPAPR